ncbi:MAG: type II secretion system protein GspC [Myxococcota bacterium]|nr:type II secretion system protein GspC [Myxococcota bacterium]
MKTILNNVLNVFRSRRVLAGLGVVTLASVLSGVALSQLLEAKLALPDGAVLEEVEVVAEEQPERPRPAAPKGRVNRTKEFYSRPILARNLFDPDAVAVVETVDTEDGRPTDLEVRLLATVVAVPVDYSSALIVEDKRGARARGYGVGYSLLGQGVVHAIEKKRVIIRRTNGDIEYLDMSDEKGKRDRPADKGAADGEVQRDGDNFTVERSLLDDAMENMDKLATQVRVVPHKGSGGEIDGYRLSAIRRGTLFDKLGIKNGDIVHTVNGQALTSTSEAMSAYQGLQNDSSFTFEITRRNKKKTLSYQIR